ncbi:DUF1848 domain-containing protein [[Eubacterium] hominis]|uniref:DUF1848 domain-containing protein n=1 Tax=[Eubacterium] hominis TaxID=2764325 RepID=UPI003A4D636E
MILFVSGRSDIPAFYSRWFFNRIKAGFVDVRNPFNPHQISRIPLTKEQIDVIVFCTKNPIPMLSRLEEIPFPYLFHITLTAYRQDIEPYVPDKRKIIEAIQLLSQKIGKKRVIVRYDPIILTDTYTIAYHIKAFERLCQQLQGFIETIIISFVDMYKNTKQNMTKMKMRMLTNKDMYELGKAFGEIAQRYHIQLQTCAEEIDLSEFHIKKGLCMNMQDITEAIGHSFEVPKGKGVRKECGCLPSVDIGDYNCCSHECLYCYANYDAKRIHERVLLHDEHSSVLLGYIEEEDRITIRKKKGVSQNKLDL